MECTAEKLERIRKLIYDYQFQKALNLFENTIGELETILLRNKELAEMVNLSLQNRDYLLLSDLIAYEFMPEILKKEEV
jgi:hypothetical protein